MAANQTGLDDIDRDEEDWIEIHNGSPETINLDGWTLTDKVDNPTKWALPSVNLYPNAYLIVFASQKDRAFSQYDLHTNFKLSSQGEYLALIRPDGTVASEFSPLFPIQLPDVSYGITGNQANTALVAPGATAKALIPENASLRSPTRRGDTRQAWTLETLDDHSWLTGTTGIGYDHVDLIGLDVSAMRNKNQSVYVRIPFEVEDPTVFKSLTLRMRYEDGMIVYLNGYEVTRANAPAPGQETWNSGAAGNRSDSEAVQTVDIPVTDLSILHPGTNLLAIQGLNDGIASSDLLILPELWTTVDVDGDASLRYFPYPTPGKPNNAGVKRVGPAISNVDHAPLIPTDTDDLLITAKILPSFDPIASVHLHYRVMFTPEVILPLLQVDRRAEAVYHAHIPADALETGQMVRWYITATDSMGRETRYPRFMDPDNAPQYDGTVVDDPSLTNPLQVMHRFIQNPNAANTDAGTRCALFFDGVFYDNLLIYLHGQSSRGFPKKSYNIDFHPGCNFKWANGEPRADDINLLTTYPDKAQMRNILAHETYRDADCPFHWVIPVRIQQNTEFWGTAHAMENGDEDWLVRMGINAEGALYKMYNTFTSAGHATSGAEKKTRKHENNYDLQQLFEGLSLGKEARRTFLYDHVDVAQVVNFLAARTLTGDTDCCHKNYYFYCDTGISDEWQMWPWDVDLSFGRRWISSHTYWDQRMITNTPVFAGSNNRMPQAIYGTAEMRQMYLRRLRSLMDELLKPPGTALEDLHYEHRMDELALLIAPDAALDALKWNSHAWGNGSTSPCCPQSLWEAVEEMKYLYLPERRIQLYDGLTSGARELPDAQPPDTVIAIGELELVPSSGRPEEAFIQLQNANDYAVDISGWVLDGHLQFVFRGGTVIPAQTPLYVAADRVAFRRRTRYPTGGRALFVVGDYAGSQAAANKTLTLINRQNDVVDVVEDIDSHIAPEFIGNMPRQRR
jgi:hypothetical protein